MHDSKIRSGFLAQNWQKQPTVDVFALPDGLPALTPGEIGWLATQPDVESRLVFTEYSGGNTNYRLETGPFSATELEGLPERDWTLLVQDVDKHLPEFAAWFGMSRSIPRWRIDDLMVSVAAQGGSVGPHQDNYDVFLCQGQGRRRWTLGDPANVVPAEPPGALSVLQPFEAEQSFMAGAGHVLYIPPGVPHWGIAEELCITYSIGFRAPSNKELCATARRVLDTPVDVPGEETLYADPDLAADEADDSRISERTLQRVRAQGLLDTRIPDPEIARMVGMTVTDPKAWLDPDPCEIGAIDDAIGRGDPCRVHGMALLAWYRAESGLVLFLNGRDRNLTSEWEPVIRTMCRDRALPANDCLAASSLPDGRKVLAWLCQSGLFDAAPAAE